MTDEEESPDTMDRSLSSSTGIHQRGHFSSVRLLVATATPDTVGRPGGLRGMPAIRALPQMLLTASLSSSEPATRVTMDEMGQATTETQG